MIFIFIASSLARLALAIGENSVLVPVGGGTYKEGELGQPIAINPLISQNPTDLDVSALVYGNLFDLISAHEESKDGRLYTLKLKEGLRWSDNEPLSADDIVFTIQSIQDPDTKSPLAKDWQGIVAERISEIQVQLNLPAPYAFFKENLRRLPVVPKHIFGAIPNANFGLSAYNLEPVGSGPYRFKDFAKRRDGFITDYNLTVNENYAGQKPFIKDFDFKFYAEGNDLLQALRLRQINGFGSLTPFTAGADEIGNLKIEKIPMPRYYAIFLNQNVNPLLKKIDLRRALAEAVDKNRINAEIFRNEATVIAAPFFDASASVNPPATPYDPGDAQKLIDGIKKNNPLELTIVVPEVDFLKKTAQIIQDEWQTVGINKVNVLVLNQNDLLDRIKARDYELLLFGNALQNPLDLFPLWHSSGRFYPGLNLALYQNSKIDNLLEAIRQDENADKEKAYLQNAANLIANDYPAVFLFALPYTYLHTTNLTGFAFGDGSQYLTAPADRFRNVNQWSVSKVRILKTK